MGGQEGCFVCFVVVCVSFVCFFIFILRIFFLFCFCCFLFIFERIEMRIWCFSECIFCGVFFDVMSFVVCVFIT